MHMLVKITANDDGDPTDNPDDWHLVDPSNHQGAAALCTQYFFGDGESAAEFEVKDVKRGGITCQLCLDMVKSFKAVKL